MITMYDSVSLGMIPSDAQALACYVDGAFANSAEARDRFPHARILTIAVFAAHDADALDIETGDATPGEAAGWYFMQRARGLARPCLYASASVMQEAVVPAITAAGIPRSAVRLWSAHYTKQAHRCGPSSCGLMSIEADATQYDDRALNRDLDVSLVADDFFGPAPHPSPVPSWQEAMLQALPVVKQGDTGPVVRTIQGLAVARGYPTKVDGAFGAITAAVVASIQRNHGLTPDSAVGPLTWPVLLGV